jgi:hypothetical protein
VVSGRYGAPQELDFGALLSRSFANLWLIRWQVLIYLGIFTVAAFVVPLLGEGITSGGGFIAYLFGQYVLFQAVFKARKAMETPRLHFFSFILLALVLIIPIILGLVALLLPGLFLVARWIAAPAFVVARGRGVFEAATDSWNAVRGNTGKVAGAVVVMVVIVSCISAVISAIGGALDWLNVVSTGRSLEAIEAHFLPLALLGLSTATYELLGPEDTTIEEVFG